MLNAENSAQKTNRKQNQEKRSNERENSDFGFSVSDISPAVICTAAAIGSTQTVAAGLTQAASTLGNQNLLAMLEYGSEESKRIGSIASIMHDEESRISFGGCPETEFTPREAFEAAEQVSFGGDYPTVGFAAVEALTQPYMV
ncbi:MAG: hypothetical protein ACI4KM_11175 [Oscillospiraceae bacterium]